jgi:hypothetical protein
MLRVLPVLIILATVIYLVVRLVQGRADGGGSRGKPKTVAPDDDPTFLRDLDDQLWRERRNETGPE